MSNINQLNLASIPVYNAQVPAEGPKAIPIVLDFTASTSYSIDGQILTTRDIISMVQSIFVDTTGATSNVIVSVRGSNQSIICKPNTQGYYPVVCPNPFGFTFTCANGPNNALVILLNIPVAPAQWATA